MRVRIGLPFAVGFVALGLSAAVPATPRAAVYVSELAFSPGLRQRPATIVGGDSYGFSGLVWRAWGGRRAVASGMYRGLDFSDGTEREVTHPVTVTLSRPVNCGGYRLYTRAIAASATAETPPSGAVGPIGNVGCRLSILQGGDGRDPVILSLERPRTFPRPPSRPFENLRWRRWGKPVTRARGIVVEGRRKRVRITATDVGYCGPDHGLVYRIVRVTVGHGAGSYRYISRWRGYCRGQR